MTDRTDTSHLEGAEASHGEDSARLFFEEPGRPPRVVMLARGAAMTVGRGAEAALRIDDLRASRVHAQWSFDGAVVRVRDLDSSNGTWLGDRKVEGEVEVPSGALVRVGGTRVVVVPPDTARDARPETHGPVVGVAASGADVVASDPTSVRLFALARRLAASDLPVLIQGETGSGKEVVARCLHRHSPRAGAPFIAVNCASLPESLAESELFGHERGSFTGAYARKVGVFEGAAGGVLLLDEVGELSTANQARLLRVLQERVIVRVGANEPVSIDVRVVCATNRDLAVEVARRRFREDLYFRLNGVTVEVPPLRERPLDVIPLAQRVIADRGGGFALGPGVVDALQGYAWPGNVRELRNAIDCAIAMAEGTELRLEHLPLPLRGAVSEADPSPLRSALDGAERRAIIAALEHHHGNQSRAARELGISRRGLIYKMERHGLKPRPGQHDDE